MESPDVPGLLQLARDRVDAANATSFLGRESIVACRGWRARLYALMHRTARPAAEFFGIPPNQVLEVGAQVDSNDMISHHIDRILTLIIRNPDRLPAV